MDIINLTEKEYAILCKRKGFKDKIQNTRSSSSVRKNNSKSKICKQTIPKIQKIQSNSEDFLFIGNFGIKIKATGESRADIDNIAKGILDSLEKVAYANDRKCRQVSAEFC